MNRAAIVALGVGVVVVVGLGAVLVGGFGLNEDVTFNLQKDAQGVCKPSNPDPITTLWLRHVTWTVTNVNCDPQYVSLRNFKEVLSGGGYGSPEDIVKPKPPVDGGPIATGATLTLPKVHVDKFVFFKTKYKYEIWNGVTSVGVTLGRDPDIDIWP